MLILLFFIFLPGLVAQHFTEMSDPLGLVHSNNLSAFGAGLSFFDFDNDGWDDLTISTKQGDSLLFYKNNQGNFYKTSINIPITDHCKQVQWIDIDNDNDLDLFVAVYNDDNLIYIQDTNNSFNPVTLPAYNASNIPNSYAAAFGDFDLDGDLDIFMVHRGFNSSNPNQLFINNGNNQFVDLTDNYFFNNIYHPSFSAVFFDPNKDQWPDIYVADDKNLFSNQYYKNLGGGQFLDESSSSQLNIAVDAMGLTIGDYNNDQLSDIFVTNTIDGNILFHNNGDGTFTDTSAYAGVLCNKVCWSTHFFDFDNDCDLDLHACATLGSVYANTNCMSENLGNGIFADVSHIFLGGDSTISYSSALGDLNNDGYLDMAVTNTYPDSIQFWLNSGGTKNWLKVKLIGTSSNSMGIGSWIDLYHNNQHYSHYTYSGSGYQSQNTAYNHFGLDTGTLVDSIIVQWPCGHVDKIYNVNANQTILITEGSTDALKVKISSSNNGLLCISDTTRLYTMGKYKNYLWSTGDTTQSIHVNQSGSYSVTVSDWNNNYSSDTLLFSIANTQNVQAQINPVSCVGSHDGDIELLTGGNNNLFQYNWSNGSSNNSLYQLSSGLYGVTFTDLNGCSDSLSLFIQDPLALNSASELVHIGCFGDSTGSIELNVNGGYPPYQFNWSNGSSSNKIEQIPMGQYNVMITDSMNCNLSETYILTGPLQALNTILIDSDTLCPFDGSGFIQTNTMGGAPPYSYSWSTGDTMTYLSNLNGGLYSLTITDQNACELIIMDTLFQYDSISVQFLMSHDTGNGGSIQILFDPADSLLFSWSNGSNSSMINGLSPASYSLTITDHQQCTQTYEFNIMMVLGSNKVSSKLTDFNIFPVPANDLLNIDLSDLNQSTYYMHIIDVHRRPLIQHQFSGTSTISVPISTLYNGIYFIEVYSDQFYGLKKFIKLN